MQKGSYVLVMELHQESTIMVGRLGPFLFPAGYYLYMGSALGGLSQRINRYLQEKRNLHWHIDYLLEQAKIMEIWYTITSQRMECQFAQAACALPRASVPVKGFGASDCKCDSHLIHLHERPTIAPLKESLETLTGCGVALEPFIMER
ncbi:MAG: GIY-YIG nuclease family protein [Dehalococcoidia bacterium]